MQQRDSIERAFLPGGLTIHVRPIEAGDHARLEEAFEHLSAESRYQRFLSPVRRLGESDIRYFTQVDHRDHEALVAIEPDHGHLVGVARYVRVDPGTPTAEVAMVVADLWHGRGVATLLLEELADRARAVGIREFTATCLASNAEAIEVLEHLGLTDARPPDEGVTDLTIDLTRDADDRLAGSVDVPH